VLAIPVVSSTPGPVSAPPAAAPTPSLPLPSPSPFGSIIDEKNVEVRSENVLVLSGHGSEVFMGTWNPKLPLFATCAADATARVWRLQPGPITSKTISEAAKQPSILKHTPVSSQTAGNSKAERAKEVTAMDWNPSGTLLATGSSDGIARIWDAKGTLKHKLQKHTSHIFVLKWSKSGDYLLSGSADKLAIVWDTSSGSVKQVFDFHTQPCLDVDWRNNNSFATCSGDTLIHVCELGRTKPVVTFSGHTSEVNAIRWDPQGQILASCSDDKTAKLWRMDSTKPIQDLKGHDLDIYTLRWSPTGPGSKNPSKSPLLATASFDKTVRIWDTTSGNCLQTLDRHEEAVYSISFSPDGEYIASGSLDRCLNIWSVKDGSLVKSHKGSGSINDVSWSSGGERVAACCSDNTVAIIDFRM
jgi:transducin (beta)-like 1